MKLMHHQRTGATSSQLHTSLSTFTKEDKVNQMIESKTQTGHEEEVNEKDTNIDANTDADTNINTIKWKRHKKDANTDKNTNIKI